MTEFITINETWIGRLRLIQRLCVGAPNYAAIKPLLEDFERPLAFVDSKNKENEHDDNTSTESSDAQAMEQD